MSSDFYQYNGSVTIKTRKFEVEAWFMDGRGIDNLRSLSIISPSGHELGDNPVMRERVIALIQSGEANLTYRGGNSSSSIWGADDVRFCD